MHGSPLSRQGVYQIKSRYPRETLKNLKTALDIRKFEIDLYWKRAGYFWAFIAAIFAGFFWVIKQMPLQEHVGNLGFIFGCMGAVTSKCWHLVLRGSKYWQGNWERHVDYLEDEVQGRLYKTILSGKNLEEFNPLDAYPFSVSKVNALLAHFVFLFWFGALIYLAWLPGTGISQFSLFFRMLLVAVTLGFVGLASVVCKTSCCEAIFSHQGHDFVPRQELKNIKAGEGQENGSGI